MLKIAVFDTGYGGELFADQLEKELPTTEIIRIIDWRNAEKLTNRSSARKIIENALKPYINRVNLIVIANYYTSATVLNYLKRKYKNQKFIGFTMNPSRIKKRCPTLIITTSPTTRSLSYFNLHFHIRLRTICLDNWPLLIDDGELTPDIFKKDLSENLERINKFKPKQIFLACGQFSELKPMFREAFGHNTRIVDSFDQTIRDAYRALGLHVPKS